MDLQQFINVLLYAKKASNETITGSWTFQQPVTIDISSASYGLTLDNDGAGNNWIQLKTAGSTLAEFRSAFGIPGLFAAPGQFTFFSNNDPFGATPSFILFSPAGVTALVGDIVEIDVSISPFVWTAAMSFAYQGAHTFTNHRTDSGPSWSNNNLGVMTPGIFHNWIHSGIQIAAISTVGDWSITGFIDQLAIAAPATPASSYSRLYNVADNGFNKLQFKESTGIVHTVCRDIVIIAQNTSGGALANGDAVYIKAAAGGVPTIAKSDAKNIATMPCVGAAMEAISNNAYGRVMVSGRLTNQSTTGFTAGRPLYVSTTPGRFTTTQPAHPNYSQVVGVCTVVHASSGVIELFECNLDQQAYGSNQNTFTIGDAATAAKVSLKFANNSTLSLEANPTSPRVLTLPDATDTVVGKATTDVLTNKTLSGNVATNFSNGGTVTLPSGVETLVGRATTDTLTNKTLTSPTINTPNITSPTITGPTLGEDANFHWPSSFGFLFEDFSGNSTSAGQYTWSNQSSGAGAAVTNVAGEADHPGIRQFTTGTTAAGFAGLNTRTTFIDPDGGDCCRMILRLSANTGIILRLGIQDTFTGADVTDGYYFEFDPATSANWLMCTAAGGSRTKTASSSAVAATTWYRLDIVVNSANTSVEFFVDGVSIGTVATNIPTNTTGVTLMIQNDGVSTTSVNCDLDVVYWYNKTLNR